MKRFRQSSLLLTARIVCLAAGALSFAAHAEICAYENIDGKRLYTNVKPGPGWEKRECFKSIEPPPPPKTNNSKSSTTRSTLPKVTSEQQKQRDTMRRQVLEEELATENRLLRDAKNALVVGTAPASAAEIKDTQRYQQRIKQLRDTVALHERNVDALRKEIARIN
jgi:hypothetical protein